MLGAHYAFGVAAPFVWVEIDATLNTSLGATRRCDSTNGIGPALGYLIPGEKSTSVAEIRWLPELQKSERLRGDYFWFKLAYEF